MASDNAQWYREMGDTYTRIAEQATSTLAKEANASEAAKYYGMARAVEGRQQLAGERETAEQSS